VDSFRVGQDRLISRKLYFNVDGPTLLERVRPNSMSLGRVSSESFTWPNVGRILSRKCNRVRPTAITRLLHVLKIEIDHSSNVQSVTFGFTVP